MRKKFSLPGFTLWEMSLVLIIIGIIGGITFPLLNTLLTHQRHKQTETHQEQVMFSLASYVLQHYRLPLPATEMTGISSDETCQNGICRGHIPFKTLGIDEALTKDGQQRWMTYVMHPDMARHFVGLNGSGDHHEQHFCTITGRELVMEDESFKELKHDMVAVVLISHPHDQPARLKSHPKQRIKVVTRNNLLAIYGHRPCARGDYDQRRHPNPIAPATQQLAPGGEAGGNGGHHPIDPGIPDRF